MGVLRSNPSFYRNICRGSTIKGNLFNSVWLQSAEGTHDSPRKGVKHLVLGVPGVVFTQLF